MPAMTYRTISNTFLAALAVALCLTGTALAQPTTVVAFELARPGALLSSPKDAELRASLAAVPARWDRLVESIGSPELQDAAPFVQALFTVLSRPLRFAVTDRGVDPDTGAPGLGVAFAVSFNSRDDASAFHDRVRAALDASGVPPMQESRSRPGSLMFETPLGEATFGPARAADGSWSYSFLVGETSETLGVFPLADAEGSLMSAELHLAALAPYIEPALAEIGDDDAGAAVLGWLRDAGVIGADAMSIEYVADHRNGALVQTTRLVGGAARLEAMGLEGGRAIRDADLGIVPASAIMGSVFRADPSVVERFVGYLRQRVRPVDEHLSELEARTTLSLPGDLLEPLGSLSAYYTSPATGGLGFLGSAFVMELNDAGALADRVGRLASEFNGFAGEMLREPGERFAFAVRVRQTGDAHGALFVLEAPGLPLPVEPSLVVGERFAAIALSPAGARAAVDQAHGRGDEGLLANHRVARDLGAPGKRIGVEFYDGPAAMARGYPIASLALTALANAVRSPDDVSRGPSRPIPSFTELARDARATTAVTWVDGDDVRSRTITDASQTVLLAQTAPLFSGGNIMVWSTMAGILFPALERAKHNAEGMRDGAHLKQIHLAGVTYATSNNDRLPESLEPLLANGSLVPEILQSPLGEVGDGKGDYFLRPNAENMFRADVLHGYSRSSYTHGNAVSVVYGDNYVEQVSFDRFFEILDAPANQGIDWQLPFEE